MALYFDGETYDPEFDRLRLTTLFNRVKRLMSDEVWRTLRQISDATGGSEASVSARLRDLRKARFGGYVVDRKRIVGGLHKYRVLLPSPLTLFD